ncbi:MAG: hypothetical protein H0T62_03860 [Parachlamydiaceae bacterium]|nr:hypothetical protein [Parachlamydiaceae bacterium]
MIESNNYSFCGDCGSQLGEVDVQNFCGDCGFKLGPEYIMRMMKIDQPTSALELINAIDLTQFRNADLPTCFYLLLLIPIIGWIALPCLKIYYLLEHDEMENFLKIRQFDIQNTDEKIKILSELIQPNGPLAWQYQLELTKQHLLNEDYDSADTLLSDYYPGITILFGLECKNVIAEELVSIFQIFLTLQRATLI